MEGGKLGIFPSPKASLEGESWELFISPRAYIGWWGELGILTCFMFYAPLGSIRVCEYIPPPPPPLNSYVLGELIKLIAKIGYRRTSQGRKYSGMTQERRFSANSQVGETSVLGYRPTTFRESTKHYGGGKICLILLTKYTIIFGINRNAGLPPPVQGNIGHHRPEKVPCLWIVGRPYRRGGMGLNVVSRKEV